MKNLKVILSAFVIAGAMFVGCSDDDNGSTTGGELKRRWNPQKTEVKIGNDKSVFPYTNNDPNCQKNYVEFTDDNHVRVVGFADPIGTGCVEIVSPEETTYTRNDNTLVIDGIDLYDGTWEIIRLTNSELRIRRTDAPGGVTTITTVFFKKAAIQG